uniref:F-box associated domain-containing protein n=1 Tax=Leersia perrieri TaxID=77586 RepID=A0A0D9X972_9ORYZ
MFSWRADELVVHSIGSAAEQPRTVLAGLDDDKICRRSLYMDGTVYLLNVNKATVLAFDVDDETITSIDLPLPGERVADGNQGSYVISELMEMSGRVCVATLEDVDKRLIAVWLLTADRRCERRCLFHNAAVSFWDYNHDVAGVWDCGGVLLIFMQAHDESCCIFLYDDATEGVYMLNAPPNATPERMDYRICWGYKPTLVSPANIVGELSQDEKQLHDLAVDLLAALKPVNDMEKRKGQDATLTTVCFMEFLAGIMRKLPSKLHHGIGKLDRFY